MVDKVKKAKDLKFGDGAERDVLDILKALNPNTTKIKDKYYVMDYSITDDDGKLIEELEVKSRRIKHNQYPTLVFGKNKYNHSLKQLANGIKQTYLFNCRDGLYKWELTDPVIQKNEFYEGTICNYARNDKPHSAIHIYTQNLVRVW